MSCLILQPVVLSFVKDDRQHEIAQELDDYGTHMIAIALSAIQAEEASQINPSPAFARLRHDVCILVPRGLKCCPMGGD